jgi:hypothetical protein
VRAIARAALLVGGNDSGIAMTIGLPLWVLVCTRYCPIATKAR